MPQIYLLRLSCLVLLTISISGRYTGSQLGQNFDAQPLVLGHLNADDAWVGVSSPTGFLPQLNAEFHGREKRSTVERKKRFLPGGVGAPVLGFIPPGELPGPFMPPPLLPPIVPPMIPPIFPLPPPISPPPPFPYPMIAPYSLASPLLSPFVPRTSLPANSGPGTPLGFITEPFFEKPFDVDFGLGGGFRFSSEYDDEPAGDIYFEPFPFPAGYDTYGKVVSNLRKLNQTKATSNKNKYDNSRYGKSYSNPHNNDNDYGYSKKSYDNSYSNGNNANSGSRRKTSYRKNPSYKPRSMNNNNNYYYNYRKRREYGFNAEQQSGFASNRG